MEILILIALAMALIWAMVALRYSSAISGRVRLIPVIGFLVIFTGSVLSYDFFHIPAPIPITLDRLFLGALVGVFVWHILHRRESIRRLNVMDLSVLMLTTVISLSTITHDFTFLKNMPASRLLFFNLFPLALYAVMRQVRLDDVDLKMFSLGFIALGIYLAVTALAETRGLNAIVFPRYIMNPEFEEFLGRGRGPFLNPVSNGVCMVVCLTCLWMWFPNRSLRGKAVVIAIAILMALGVYSTYTRSVWMGLVIAAVIVVFWQAPQMYKGAMVVAATVLLIGLAPFMGDKLLSFKRDKNVSLADMENSARLRPLFLIVAERMVVDRPFWGVGFGQYARAKYPYLQDQYSEDPLSMTRGYMQHNIFLAYVTETGFIGLSALVMMLAVFLRTAWATWRDPRLSHWKRQFGLLLIVMLVNHCVNGMFHDVSIIPMENMLLLFLAAITNNVYSAQTKIASDALAQDEQSVYRGSHQPVTTQSPHSGSMAT